MDCMAKIRPFPNMNIYQCEKQNDSHTVHETIIRDYAYPGSQTKMIWDESDRRTFRGVWNPCAIPGCVLPENHKGNHAF